MPSSSIMKRRRVRELEARRDRLMEQKQKVSDDLAKVRTELKSARKAPA